MQLTIPFPISIIMPTILQINTVATWGSTGRIADSIGDLALDEGWRSVIAYGREPHYKSNSELIRIGSNIDVNLHGVASRIFDSHGLWSKKATRHFIKQIDNIKPDIIHLHNIHGYYLHFPTLFNYLRLSKIPTVWTLHDCWPFTGHCTHYMARNCARWQTGCHHCPAKKEYPASFVADRSVRNYHLKKQYFTGLQNLTLVPVSEWLACDLRKSFLKDANICVINNGVDVETFKPCFPKSDNVIIGVASVWDHRKGLDDFVALRKLLDSTIKIKVVGLTKKQINALPDGIEGISRTNSVKQLAQLYSEATVLVNPTYEDNFPTVNLEALACGTPVITYNTGGSPEAIDVKTGGVVERGDINAIVEAFNRAKSLKSEDCRERAEKYYNSKARFAEYINLYISIIK